MNRRFVLQGTFVALSPITAGCLSGGNETLEIRNGYNESVTLDISIQRGSAPDERQNVFEETVEVPANQTVTHDVLGNDQYYITVAMRNDTHEFGTRPICDRAFTRIIVTEDGELTSEIQDCE